MMSDTRHQPSSRTAVITGASGGIGRATAHAFATAGVQVIVGYGANDLIADSIVENLPGDGHFTWPIDVASPDSIKALAERLADTPGKLDILVNCAAITRSVRHDNLDGLDDELIDAIFRINWRGPFATIRALHPLLRLGTEPVIVNVSSIAGVTGQGSNIAYCASKAALDSMTRSLGRSLAPAIRVISVAPGWVEGDYAARMPAETLEDQRRLTPMARLAKADDVADAICMAALGLRFTTGAIIPVDGGRVLGTS